MVVSETILASHEIQGADRVRNSMIFVAGDGLDLDSETKIDLARFWVKLGGHVLRTVY